MTPNEENHVADVIPPKWRRRIYIFLAFAGALFSVVYAAVRDGLQPEDVPIILTGILSTGGFGMAASNTLK